jgi:formamidopyrimidine-DNA glycosylase
VPEGLEVEWYRRAAEAVVGRRIRGVQVDERNAVGPVAVALRRRRVTAVDRVGKLLLLVTDGPVLGIHFGMTGRIVVDGVAPIESLEYGSGRDDPAWDRLVLTFEGRAGGSLRVNDPRRWSRYVLDPDPSSLGPDAERVTADELARRLRRGRPLKALLLDQAVVAGLGNMCVDEVLFHAGLAPDRPGRSLSDPEVPRLVTAVRTHLPAMFERGGSHTGVLSPEVRATLPACPLDGEPLHRTVVRGRTTIWCPAHQR